MPTYWNLDERPFEATWDRRFYFKTAAHEEALRRLEFLAGEESMGLGMLTGEIGSGKTLVRALFLEQLPERYQWVVLENSSFSFNELLGAVLRGLKLERNGDSYSKLTRYERLREFAEALPEQKSHLVVVFDEAQEMSVSTLAELKLLANLNGDGQNCLTLALVGQPELSRRVRRLPPIDQRMGLCFHLRGLTEKETGQYLAHRLRVAGHPTGQLFTDGAVQALYSASGGIPRDINRIAKLSLELAWGNDLPVITTAAVRAVARDLQRTHKLQAA